MSDYNDDSFDDSFDSDSDSDQRVSRNGSGGAGDHDYLQRFRSTNNPGFMGGGGVEVPAFRKDLQLLTGGGLSGQSESLSDQDDSR